MNRYINRMTAEEKVTVLSDIMQLMADKVIRPYIGKVFKLSEAAAAVRESCKAARGGKVFLDSR